MRFIPSVTYNELGSSLLYYKPNVVHFAGIGLRRAGLLTEYDGHGVKILSEDDISDLFKVANNSNNIKCVALSAPFSLEHAESIKKYVPSVIGFDELNNDEAESFFARFYELLGAGLSIDLAFQSACKGILQKRESLKSSIQSKFNLGSKVLPSWLELGELPMLKYAPGIDPSKLFLAKIRKTKSEVLSVN